MNGKAWFVCSLAANVIAAIFLARNFSRPDESLAKLTQDNAGERPAAKTSEPKTLPGSSPQKTTSASESRTAAGSGGLPKIWDQVAVADYKQFAGNLRAIGMPEETVRDIVMLDLMKSLGEDMQKISSKIVRPPFWRSRRREMPDSSVTNEVAAALDQFSTVTRDVLGIAPADWMSAKTGWLADIARDGNERNFSALEESLFSGIDMADKYSWMPADRRAEIVKVISAYERKTAELVRKQETAASKDDRDAIAVEIGKLEEEQSKAENSFLLPAEHREQELREDTALQMQLAGANVSRSEYEQLHDLARSYNISNAPYFPVGTPQSAQALNMLGADRFAEFQRGADPKYGELLRMSEAQNIPVEISHKLDDIRRACLDEIQHGAPYNATREAAYASAVAASGTYATNTSFEAFFKYSVLPAFTPYTVLIGDSLDDIAKKHNLTPAQILNANGISNGTILPGQEIVIPQLNPPM